MRTFHSLEEIQSLLNTGKFSCLELINHYITVIKNYESLNAFVEVFHDEARQRAVLIDKKISQGKAGKLAGLVIGVKDLICVSSHHVQAASSVLENFTSEYSATVIDRLLEEDAVIIGRLNCDEFGMGSSSENSCYGPVHNGIDPTRVAGGSSGGSAVAVQMDMCLASLGTDTGGSVRQPASFCGVVGLKPTYSRISRYGLIAYASSFDTIGILSKSIDVNARILEAIAGHDPLDSSSSSIPVDAYNASGNILPNTSFCYDNEVLKSEGLDVEVKECFTRQLENLQKKGYRLEGIKFPYNKYVLPTYYLLTMAEASSNLSRYDGVRYGYREPGYGNLLEMYERTRTNGFGPEVKRRLMLGTFVLSAGYYDAYYSKAQKVRRLIKEHVDEIFSTYDYILSPTTPGPAFNLGIQRKNPVEMYLEDLFTVQSSLAGIPSISVPMGKNRDGLPLGLQISANMFKENALYYAGKMLMNLN